MSHEMMSVEQLAVFLHRDAREVQKMASRGYLPAHKVSGEYRFHPAEISYWIETQLPNYSDEELTNVEKGAVGRGQLEQPLISTLLSGVTIASPLLATTKVAVIRSLVTLAEQSWQVYDPPALFEAVKTREELSSTALGNGVAIPHPRRPMADALGESIIAFGRTPTPIAFGGTQGGLTDLFFLVCCRDDRTHVQVLARLSRLMLLPTFLDELRGAETPACILQVVASAEAQLLE